MNDDQLHFGIGVLEGGLTAGKWVMRFIEYGLGQVELGLFGLVFRSALILAVVFGKTSDWTLGIGVFCLRCIFMCLLYYQRVKLCLFCVDTLVDPPGVGLGVRDTCRTKTLKIKFRQFSVTDNNDER